MSSTTVGSIGRASAESPFGRRARRWVAGRRNRPRPSYVLGAIAAPLIISTLTVSTSVTPAEGVKQAQICGNRTIEAAPARRGRSAILPAFSFIYDIKALWSRISGAIFGGFENLSYWRI